RTFSHTPLFFFLITRPPPRSTLFPYTTLFRSHQQTARQPDESGLRQIRVFAQRYGEPAQRHRGAEQHEHLGDLPEPAVIGAKRRDRKSTRLNSSHVAISYAVFCLKKKKKKKEE